MYVFCVGMYRACSTWQYAIVSDLIERHYHGRRLGFLTGGHFHEHKGANPAHTQWEVLKSHDAHSDFASCLRDGRALAVYSYRDLREVAFSLMHKFRASFDDVIKNRLLESCLENDAVWTNQPNLCCQRYETIVTQPVRAIHELAKHLGLSLTPQEAENLAKEYSPQTNQQRTFAFRDRLTAEDMDISQRNNVRASDPRTLLHWNHFREEQAGSWRDNASPRQRKQLADICGGWLIDRGYECNRTWAEPVEVLRSQAASARDELRSQTLQLKRLRAEMQQTEAAQRFLLEQAKKRVAELEELGPVTLKLARRWRQFAARHQRGCGYIKPIVFRLRRLLAS
jgi:hypothetical protein